jgi:hypothetical protein
MQNVQPMKVYKALAHLHELLSVESVSRLTSFIPKPMETCQCQPIGIRVHLGVLVDVPARHPWTHDTKRKCHLRDLDDGE